MTRKIDRRENPRTEVRWPVSVKTDMGIVEGETRDLGVDGISICFEEPLPVNEMFSMSIIPPHHETIQVTGRVIWSDFYGIDEKNTSLGLGICFVEISEEDRHFFNDLVLFHLGQ